MSELTKEYFDDSLKRLDLKFKKRIEESGRKFEQRIEESNHKFEQPFKEMDERLNERFEQQRKNIEKMLVRFGQMIIDVVDKRTMDLDNRTEAGFTEIRADIVDIKKRLDTPQTEMDKVKIRIYDVENEIRELKQVKQV